MKKILISILAAVTLVTACDNMKPAATTGKPGTLSLSLSCDNEYTDRPLLKSGVAPAVNTDLFVVQLIKQFDEYGAPSVWTGSWTYAEFPEVLELTPGQYKIKVTSPATDITSTLAPRFEAEEGFSIVEGAVTTLEIVCSIANMKVTVVPTANFFTELTDYTISVTAEYEGVDTPVSVSWTNSDFIMNSDGTYTTDKVAYFEAVPLSVMVTGYRTLDGSDASLRKPIEITDVAPRDNHIINIDVQVTGEAKLSMIVVDSSLNDPKDTEVFVPGFEEIPIPDEEEKPSEPAQAPYMVWEANPDFDVYMIPEAPSVSIDVYAPGKIAQFLIYVSGSPIFESVISELAGDDHMDLINNVALAEMLGEMFPDFPIGADKLLGKDYVKFDLSQMVGLIPTVDAESTVVFTLVVVDQAGQRYERPVSFKAAAAN